MEVSTDELFPVAVSPIRVEQLVSNIMEHYSGYQKRLRCGSSTVNSPDGAVLASTSSLNLRGDEVAERVACGRPHSEAAWQGARQSESGLTSIVLKSRPSTYWEERELYVAAEDLCCYLNGGVNYRMLCAQFLQMLTVLLNLIKEELRLGAEVEIVPSGTFEELRHRMHTLVSESVQLLRQYNIAVPASLAQIVRQPPPPPAARDDAGGDAAPSSVTPTPSSAYTGGVVNPAVRRRPGSRGQGMADGRRPGSTSSDVATAAPTSIATAMEKRRVGPAAIITPATSRTPVPSDASRETVTARGGPVGVATAEAEVPYRRFQTLSVKNLATGGEPTKSALLTLARRSSASQRTDDTSQDAGTRRRRSSLSSALRALRELYSTEYYGKGQQFILDALQVVFSHEYDQGDVVDPRCRFHAFKQDVLRELDATLKSYSTFCAVGVGGVALSGLYLSQCLAYHVKPCAVLLDKLKHTNNARDVQTLTLTGEKLGDAGVLPLLSLLSRLYRLRYIDLSNVDIDDGCVASLCDALRHHPALRRVNLSMNHLTDACMPEVLRTAATMPQLTEVALYGCAVSSEMLHALAEQLVEQQQRRRERSQRGQEEDLYAGDLAAPAARRKSSATKRTASPHSGARRSSVVSQASGTSRATLQGHSNATKSSVSSNQTPLQLPPIKKPAL